MGVWDSITFINKKGKKCNHVKGNPAFPAPHSIYINKISIFKKANIILSISEI